MSFGWISDDSRLLEMEPQSIFTTNADKAFDEFCQQFLDGSSNLFMTQNELNIEPKNEITKINNAYTSIQINTKVTPKPDSTVTENKSSVNKSKDILNEGKKPSDRSKKILDSHQLRISTIESSLADDEFFEDVLEAYNRGCRSSSSFKSRELLANQDNILSDSIPVLEATFHQTQTKKQRHKNKSPNTTLSKNTLSHTDLNNFLEELRIEKTDTFQKQYETKIIEDHLPNEPHPIQQNSNANELQEIQSDSDQKDDALKPSSLDQYNSEFILNSDIPKKLNFQDEFLRQNTRENTPAANHAFKFVPAIEGKKTNTEPEKWLSLKVIACGMKKGAQLPIPIDNCFIDRGNFGDDAGFWSETRQGCACGIADGATGNSKYGYDPGDFSRNLMEQCSELYVKECETVTDARDLLLKAYDVVQNKTCYGSCTACVIELNHSTNELTAVNVGDSGYCIIRGGHLVHASEPQRLSFECPKQLDSYPWKEDSRRMGVSYTEILGADTNCDSIEVLKDDFIIISSDGLYDNLEYDEIQMIFHKSKTPMDAAEKLVYNSVKNYRKPDDIIVLIARVVENTTSQNRQLFSSAPAAETKIKDQ